MCVYVCLRVCFSRSLLSIEEKPLKKGAIKAVCVCSVCVLTNSSMMVMVMVMVMDDDDGGWW